MEKAEFANLNELVYDTYDFAITGCGSEAYLDTLNFSRIDRKEMSLADYELLDTWQQNHPDPCEVAMQVWFNNGGHDC